MSGFIEENYKAFTGKAVAEAIKAKRLSQKLSEKDLAELAGVSRSTVQKLESSSIDVTLSSIKKVMNAIGLELAWR